MEPDVIVFFIILIFLALALYLINYREGGRGAALAFLASIIIVVSLFFAWLFSSFAEWAWRTGDSSAICISTWAVLFLCVLFLVFIVVALLIPRQFLRWYP